MPSNRPPDEVSAGGAVLRSANGRWEICLVCVDGRWGFPKGHPKSGETVEQTARREIAEETGLAADSLEIRAALTDSDYAFRDGGRLVFKRVHNFLVTCEGETDLHRQEDEIDEARWWPLDEARDVATFKDLNA